MRNEDTWWQLWHPEEQRGTVGAAEGEKRHGANRRLVRGRTAERVRDGKQQVHNFNAAGLMELERGEHNSTRLIS